MENLKEKDAPKSNKQSVVEKFAKESKDLRLLSYKILVDKFNQKYSNLNESQRDLLKAYINNISNTSTLKDFMAEEISKLKNEILKIHPKIDDKVVSIKLKECLNVLKKLNKGNIVNEEQLITMMDSIVFGMKSMQQSISRNELIEIIKEILREMNEASTTNVLHKLHMLFRRSAKNKKKKKI